MKFKVGDKVKIVKKRTIKMASFGSMDKYLGKIMTIARIDGDWYRMKEDNGEWYWDDDMIESLAQFTKSDLKDGDIVTYRDKEKATVLRKQSEVRSINKIGLMYLKDYDENLMHSSITKYDIIKVERPTQYETVYERKEEILDEAEKRYLRDVIRPFRREVRSITKTKFSSATKQHIKIVFDGGECWNLRQFTDTRMYKNMEMDKYYTLEELRTIKE